MGCAPTNLSASLLGTHHIVTLNFTASKFNSIFGAVIFAKKKKKNGGHVSVNGLDFSKIGHTVLDKENIERA